VQVLDWMVAQPEGATPDLIAGACTTISDWANGKGYIQTAICFREIAAHAVPTDSLLAAAAGRLLRQHAYFERSKRWFERSVGLARLAGDMSGSASAYLSWANMEFHRGEHARARKLFLRAWRRARKHHLRSLGAAARHNLLALCIETGRFDEAQEHAEAAFELYGRRHKIIPTFAQDVAQLWSWQGYSEVALQVSLPRCRISSYPRSDSSPPPISDVLLPEQADQTYSWMHGVKSSTTAVQRMSFLRKPLVNIGEGAWLAEPRVSRHSRAYRSRHSRIYPCLQPVGASVNLSGSR
jgi:tetratricopeptide (TPR) repeat protein